MVHQIVRSIKNPKNKCRFCDTVLKHVVVDLGLSPLCQNHIEPDQLDSPEIFYPLTTYVCEECYLVQLCEYVSPEEIFCDYDYFSSYSDSWVEHAKAYTDMITERLTLQQDSLVWEVASNDGYLLQHFKRLGIPARGIEPATNIVRAAIDKGIPTSNVFFNEKNAMMLAERYGKADLLVGNNVLAHVPDLDGFIKGLKIMLKPDGVLTMEFPHLLRLMEHYQFDTIYHEHYSYFSFLTVEKIFAAHGLTLFDVEELKSHGGSIRIYGRHMDNSFQLVNNSVKMMKEFEMSRGLQDVRTYLSFAQKVEKVKRNILSFFIEAKERGKTVVGYGAPGKGNTLLNYCGVRKDFLDYTVDRSPYKQGRYTPGTRIPILPVEMIEQTKPDYLFILPWNLEKEITKQMAFIKSWGGKFVIPIPDIRLV